MKHITDPTNSDVLRGNVLRVLGMIVDGHRNGMPPTWGDMQAALRLTTNAISCHVRRLMGLGLITKTAGKSRTLVPTCKVELVKGGVG